MATITLFGTASDPADNGSNALSTVTLTPPASMTAGMLVIVFLQVRFDAIAWAEIFPSTTGGQTWHELVLDGTTPPEGPGTNPQSLRAFGCRFNGSWAANPVFELTAAICASGHMSVFQSDDASYFFDLDVMPVWGTHTGGTVTITGITTQTDGAVVYAAWSASDDNTWGTLTGGWTNIGGAQTRNIAGTDQSLAVAYKVMPTAGASGDVAMTQATLGPDSGAKFIIAFKLSPALSRSAPTADVIIDMENSTDATVITTAILTAATYPATAGTWAETGGTANNTTIELDAEMALDPTHAVIVNGVTYADAAATRGASYDHTQGIETPSFNFDFTSQHTIVSIGFFYKTSYLLANLSSYSSIALFADVSSEFTVWNTVSQFATEYAARLEVNTAPGLVCGPRILPNHTYWVCMLMDTVAGRSKLAIFDVENNWEQLGFTTYLPIATTDAIDRLQIYATGGSYEAHAGLSYYDDFVMAWTTPTFPLLPGLVTAPPAPSPIAPNINWSVHRQRLWMDK